MAVAAQLELPGMTELLLDSGMVDAMADLLKAYELRGPSRLVLRRAALIKSQKLRENAIEGCNKY